MPSTLRFLRQFLSPSASGVTREDTRYRRGDEVLPAYLYRPAGGRRAGGGGESGGAGSGRGSGLPGWVALHGLTRRGRDHESLDAFARALAASGTAVLVPDIPEWRALKVAPDTAVLTIRSAVLELAGRPFAAPDRVGVLGFSFGGTHALMAATGPELAGHLAAVASWGGYAGLDRLMRFLFTGDHDLDGEPSHLDPDPYGRWICAGNYLTTIPAHREDGPVADALLWLAREVGRRKILAWLPATDPLKEQARERLEGAQRSLFDLMAPQAGASPSPEDRARLESLAAALAEHAVAADPLLDPTPLLPRVSVPVFLAHGRDDRLVPWTELPRLRRALPDGRVRHALVTSLFGHSFRERRFPTPALLLEMARFVRAIRGMVRLI